MIRKSQYYFTNISTLIKKLIYQNLTGAPKNLGEDHFPDPVEAPRWPFWIFEVLIEGMMESKNLLAKVDRWVK